MCWVEKGGCGRKRIIYSPCFPRDKCVTPFLCLECGKRYGYVDLGIKRNVSKDYMPKNSEHLKSVNKRLREHCRIVFLEKNRVI